MQPQTSFDAKAFRQALGQFATGVAIITAEGVDGNAIGMTMSSFNSVSLDPPLVLFSVARSAYSLAAMTDAKGYGVNILGADQTDLSNRFAKALGDKWADVELAPAQTPVPLLSGALAHFECSPYAQYDGGDHVIFVARVLSFATNPDKEPLVFYGGSYRNLADAS